MSVRQEKTVNPAAAAMEIADAAASPESALQEGNNFCVASPENPLKRNLVVSIKATLNDFCLQKNRGTWAPSQEALRSIFQQRKFTSLDGSAEAMGDLKSVVLHNMKIQHTKSTFPMALGTKITGVDDATFSATGEAFSAIALPNTDSSRVQELQSDDVSLAYEFAKKFPGYTSQNLSEKGVHEVSQRRFVLVAHDHPIVSAISENADKLQMGEISMMPEGLVKISSSLYESILPLVKTQVDSQIKVRDFSRAQVSIAPAEYGSWTEARSEMMIEKKRPMKAAMTAALAAATNDSESNEIKAMYDKKEKELEHAIDHTPMEFHMSLEVAYNFLSK